MEKEENLPAKITVNKNGSLRIEGEFTICDPEGKVYNVSGRTVISLCRCGQSANKPFCDSSHKNAGFCHEPAAFELPPPQPKL